MSTLTKTVMLGVLALMSGIVSTATAQANIPIEACAEFRVRYDRAVLDLRDFDLSVVAPLRRERERQGRLLDREVNGPRRLEAQIREVTKWLEENKREKAARETKIPLELSLRDQFNQTAANLEAEAAKTTDPKLKKQLLNQAAENRKKARKHEAEANELERKIIGNNTKIAKHEATIAAAQEEINDIRTDPPTEGELRAKIAELDAQLNDLPALRVAKEREVRIWVQSLQLCQDHDALVRAYEALRARCPGL